MWGIVVALLSGALMSIQGVFNTEVTKQSSIWAAAGWVQLTAFLTCVILYFCTGRGEILGMFSVDKKYMLLGGVMGAFITGTRKGDASHCGDTDPGVLSCGSVWNVWGG